MRFSDNPGGWLALAFILGIIVGALLIPFTDWLAQLTVDRPAYDPAKARDDARRLTRSLGFQHDANGVIIDDDPDDVSIEERTIRSLKSTTFVDEFQDAQTRGAPEYGPEHSLEEPLGAKPATPRAPLSGDNEIWK